MITTFSIVDAGKDISYNYQDKDNANLFDDVNQGDLILGYYAEPIGKVNSVFVVKNKTSGNTLVLNKMFERIYGKSPYLSPTDMGVNMAGFAIINEDAAIEASKQEIIRRYLDACCMNKVGKFTQESVDKISRIMRELNISTDDRKVVNAALNKTEQSNSPSVAIEIKKGTIIYGKKSELFTASAAAVINALKHLAKIPNEMLLLAYSVLEPIQDLKAKHLSRNTTRLNLNDVLIALAISATTSSMAACALEQLPKLASSQLHSSVMIQHDDLEVLKKLKIDVTMGTFQDTKLLKNI